MPSQWLKNHQSAPVFDTVPSCEQVPSVLLSQQSGTGWRGSMSQVPAWLHTPPSTFVVQPWLIQ